MPLTTAEYARRWRENHPEKNKEVHKRWYNDNKEKILENIFTKMRLIV